MKKTREDKITKITLVGFFVNLVLTVFKLFAGFLGNSSAMVADAIHSFSDFATDIVVLIFVRLAGKPKDECHDYGHGKFETLATVIIGVALFGVGAFLLVESAKKIGLSLNGQIIEQPELIAIFAALISIIAKEGLFWYTSINGKKLKSAAVVANAWHHRSDALSSIGTLIGISGARFLGEKWRILDPIAAIVVSGLIIVTAIKLIKPSLDELLEKSLPKDVEDLIFKIVSENKHVYEPHNLKTRKIGANSIIELHIRIDKNMNVEQSHEITVHLENSLKKEFGEDTQVIIHVEPYSLK